MCLTTNQKQCRHIVYVKGVVKEIKYSETKPS